MNFPFPLSSARLCLALGLLSMASLSAGEDPIRLRADFHRFHHRAAIDKEAHVAFLGGSITQNAKGHTAMIPAWLRERYPDTEFTFTNAGLSSTCSVTGAFRVADEILARGPVDLLVVEFAVNDDQDAAHDRKTAIRGMEGVIRQVRSRNPAADILMVHYVNPALLDLAGRGEASVSIAAHESVAEHWNLTTVNIAAALAAATAAGSYDWERYGGVHPNVEGYRFATDFMIKALTHGADRADAAVTGHPVPEAPLDEASYGAVNAIDLQQVAWLGGWEFGPVGRDLLPLGGIRNDYLDRPLLRGEDPGSMLYLDFMGRALTAFVLAGPDSGILEVSIDGGDWKAVPLFHQHSAGLNYPRTVILADDLEPGFHLAALRIGAAKPEGSQGHAVSILKLGVNE